MGYGKMHTKGENSGTGFGKAKKTKDLHGGSPGGPKVTTGPLISDARGDGAPLGDPLVLGGDSSLYADARNHAPNSSHQARLGQHVYDKADATFPNKIR